MHIDWDDLMEDASNAPNYNISIDVDDDTMVLDVEVDVDYVGWAYADDETEGYGMMYVIDFEDLDASAMDIDETGTCANIDSSTTDAANWEDKWSYGSAVDAGDNFNNHPGLTPNANGGWSIEQSGSGQCTGVRWTGSWTWYELLQCQNYAQDSTLVEIVENAEWVNMSGSLIVNLVSPLGLYSDTGL